MMERSAHKEHENLNSKKGVTTVRPRRLHKVYKNCYNGYYYINYYHYFYQYLGNSRKLKL